MGLDSRMRLERLYLCTDTRTATGDLEDFLHAVFTGGVDMVQIRQKGMAPADELAALTLARRVASSYQALVVVNDSADLAGEFRADVLHLGQEDGKASQARRRLHRWAHIGRSTHDRSQVRQAIREDDIDYFCVGPIYPTPTKPDYAPVGLDLVRYAADRAPVDDIDAKPWWAIGGITPTTIGDVIAAGARRVVVVRALTEAADPEAAARELKAPLIEAWATPEMEAYTFAAVGNASKLVRS